MAIETIQNKHEKDWKKSIESHWASGQNQEIKYM